MSQDTIESLRQQLAELTAQLVQQSVDAANEFNAHHESMLREIDELTAQRDEVMKDAERYRWLRDAQGGKEVRIKFRTEWNDSIDDAIASGAAEIGKDMK